jgi:hypothetical protein
MDGWNFKSLTESVLNFEKACQLGGFQIKLSTSLILQG